VAAVVGDDGHRLGAATSDGPADRSFVLYLPGDFGSRQSRGIEHATTGALFSRPGSVYAVIALRRSVDSTRDIIPGKSNRAAAGLPPPVAILISSSDLLTARHGAVIVPPPKRTASAGCLLSGPIPRGRPGAEPMGIPGRRRMPRSCVALPCPVAAVVGNDTGDTARIMEWRSSQECPFRSPASPVAASFRPGRPRFWE
jgi:hypothetical protein